jgi:hypothetical protein
MGMTIAADAVAITNLQFGHTGDSSKSDLDTG